jgi:hypothetical protein
MVKGDVSHGSADRKATSFIVQRRQLSWIPEPQWRHISSPHNGQPLQWFSRSASIATFFVVQGRQAFNSSKTGAKKSSKRLTSASTQTLHLSLWSLAKSRRDDAKAEAALSPELNEPQQTLFIVQSDISHGSSAASAQGKNAPASQASLRPRSDRHGSLFTLWAKATVLIVFSAVNSSRRHFRG